MVEYLTNYGLGKQKTKQKPKIRKRFFAFPLMTVVRMFRSKLNKKDDDDERMMEEVEVIEEMANPVYIQTS